MSSTASWSRYGTAPATSPPAPKTEADVVADGDGEAAPSSSAAAAEAGVAFFSRARVLAGAAAAGRPRPWREVLDPTAFSRPDSCGEARARARRNLAYFRANYALAALLLVFLGLVYSPLAPLSMLAFLALFVAWLALYFGRGDGEPVRSQRNPTD